VAADEVLALGIAAIRSGTGGGFQLAGLSITRSGNSGQPARVSFFCIER